MSSEARVVAEVRLSFHRWGNYTRPQSSAELAAADFLLSPAVGSAGSPACAVAQSGENGPAKDPDSGWDPWRLSLTF